MKVEVNEVGGNVYEVVTADEETVIRVGVNPHWEELPFGLILVEKADPYMGRLIDRTTGFSLGKDKLDELIDDLIAARDSYEKGEVE